MCDPVGSHHVSSDLKSYNWLLWHIPTLSFYMVGHFSLRWQFFTNEGKGIDNTKKEISIGNHRTHVVENRMKEKLSMISIKNPCEGSLNQHLRFITFSAIDLLIAINQI